MLGRDPRQHAQRPRRAPGIAVGLEQCQACSGIVAPYTLSGTSFGEAVNQTAFSGAGCLGRFGKPASAISFGPINVDPTPPTVTFANNGGIYTLDQPISITCSTTDALSGMASTTCRTIAGQAYTFGVGKHDLSATGTDRAGNVGTATASFTVQATTASLKAITVQLLNATNPVQPQRRAAPGQTAH